MPTPDKVLAKKVRRRARFESTLVFMDEPLVITLKFAKNSRIVAAAIPSEDIKQSMFFGVGVSKKDWLLYRDGISDLRYLFITHTVKSYYTFDLSSIDDKGTLMVEVWSDPAPEHWLPSPRFFSSNHTEDFPEEVELEDAITSTRSTERLTIDGEWQLPDFGRFQQRFSDIYAFVASEKIWRDPQTTSRRKNEMEKSFTGRPFQGGSSYVHLFDDLESAIGRNQQIQLSGVAYNSPGYVNIVGREDVFDEVRILILNFINNKKDMINLYSKLYKYLSENRYLRMSADVFGVNNPASRHINSMSYGLSRMMTVPDFHSVMEMSGGNSLVAAKIVMSLFRRLNETASFFVQGRVSYT